MYNAPLVLSQYATITLPFQTVFNDGWSSMSLYIEKGLLCSTWSWTTLLLILKYVPICHTDTSSESGLIIIILVVGCRWPLETYRLNNRLDRSPTSDYLDINESTILLWLSHTTMEIILLCMAASTLHGWPTSRVSWVQIHYWYQYPPIPSALICLWKVLLHSPPHPRP